MDPTSIKKASCILALVGCVQFVILTIIAMFTFPGGKHPDIDSVGYNFFENFFSDLGGTVTPSGVPNPISSVLFFVALFAIGAMSMPFLVVLPSLYRGQKVQLIIARLGSAIGLVSAAAFIGVALTPWNLYMLGHIISVQVAFIGLIPLALLYLLATVTAKSRVLPLKYAAVLTEFLVAAVSYVILLFSGPGLDTPAALMINAVGQKLIVYNSIVVVAVLAYGCIAHANGR